MGRAVIGAVINIPFTVLHLPDHLVATPKGSIPELALEIRAWVRKNCRTRGRRWIEPNATLADSLQIDR
jgi:hypothetical protein